MTTVNNQEQQSRSALKREIVEEIQHEERHRRLVRWFGCLSLKLLIIAVPLLIVAAAVAKSGVYDIPLMTKWLYKPTVPGRTVTPLVGYGGEDIMKRAMARAKYDPGANKFTVDLTEQELTSLASEAIQNAGDQAFLSVKSIQMTVEEQGIELFMTLPRDDREVTVKSLFVPQVVEGEMRMDIQSLEIGALKIPEAGVKLVSQALASQLAKALSMEGSGIGELRDVRMGDKRLFLEFTPSLKLPF